MREQLGRAEIDAQTVALRRLARRLVRDPASADDLVQDAWLASLERAPDRFTSRDGWLKTVVRTLAVRRYVSDSRRQHREHAVARGACDEPVLALEQSELREQLVGALDELREPYRTVLELRFLRDLSARAIAQQLGRPLPTVKAQVARGLRLLRDRVDREWGREPARIALSLIAAPRLAPRVGPPVSLTSGTTRAAGMAAAWVALVGAIGLWIVPLMRRAAARPALEPVAASTPRQSNEGRSLAGTRVPLSTPAAPSVDPLPGALWVRAREEAAGQGVARLAIRVEALDSPSRPSELLRTNERGDLRWELPAGDWRLRPARGSERTVRVEPGVTTEVDLTIPVGIRVRGEVTSNVRFASRVEVRAVPEARVFATFPGLPDSEYEVARADASGRFDARGVDPDSWIYARKPGMSPSTLAAVGVPWASEEPYLHLRMGGASAPLVGRVVDASGQPVAGATVGVGASAWLRRPRVRYDDQWVLSDSPRFALTGPDGSFKLRERRVAKALVTVRAPGFAVWRGSAAVAQGESLEIVLERGFDVRGRCVLPDGKPGGDAEVCLVPDGPFDPMHVQADAEGRFVVEAVPTQAFTLLATARAMGRVLGGERLVAGETESGPDGVLVRLSERATIAGRALDASGSPIANAEVELLAESDLRADWEGLLVPATERILTRTDERGAFGFAAGRNGPFLLRLFESDTTGQATAWSRGVRAGAGEITLRAGARSEPSGTVYGVLTSALTERVRSAKVIIDGALLARPISVPVDLESGAFRSPKLVPGAYRLGLWLPAAEIATLGEFELAPGEALCVGRVAAPLLGGLAIQLELDEGLDIDQVVARVKSSNLLLLGNTKVDYGVAIDADGVIRADGLVPGEYIVELTARGSSGAQRSVVVREGLDTMLGIELRRGYPLDIDVQFDEPLRPGERLEVDFSSIDGEDVPTKVSRSLSRARWSYSQRLMLPAGEYRAEARTASGFRGEARFWVSGDAGGRERLSLKVGRSHD